MRAHGTVNHARVARRRWIRLALLLSDAAMLLSATMLATWIRFDTLDAAVALENIPGTALPQYYEAAIFVVALWLLFLWQGGLYELNRLFWGAREYSHVMRSLAFGLVGLIMLTYAVRMPGLSRAWTLLAWTLSVALVCFGRFAIRSGIRELRRRGRLQRPTLIVGSNSEAADLVRVLGSDHANGIHVVGCLTSSTNELLFTDTCGEDVPALGDARDVVDVVLRNQIDTVIVASTAFSHDTVASIVNELRGISVDVHISSGLFEVLTSRVLVRELSGVPLITIRGVSFSRGALRTKRAFDLLVASVIVAIGMPAWLLLALAIKLDSRGPVFYKQPRVGRGGEPFGMYKFRSMCDDADARLAQLLAENEADGPLFKMRADPRVTRIGRWMRKFSIDEFPQLINVLRGEMSLVGPRPPLIHEAEEYTERDWRRMEVPPGMTGLWQVSGRSSLTFDEMVKLDLFYIENWSVGFDLALLARTVPAVLFARGAY